jgi:uncharacterized YceG family protein
VLPPPVEPIVSDDGAEIPPAPVEDSGASLPAPAPLPPAADAPAVEASAVEPPPAEPPPAEPPPAEPPIAGVPVADRPEPEPTTYEPPAPEPPSTDAPARSRTPLPPPAAWAAPDGRAQGASLAQARSRRSPPARLAAVIALLAAIAVVVLLVRTLRDSRRSGAVAVPPAVKVVIPEGKTGMQIAQIASADGLTGSYRAAAKRSVLLNPARYGAPHGTSGLEGFLFPATYEMKPHAPVGRLVDEQLAAFAENFGADDIRRARALHLTPYELLIVASMVEREAKVASERPKIAAVIYNRLRRGMPLGIDATIYYAIEQREGIPTYTHELTDAQLHVNSAYNTRTRKGLPPTPISNPGLASIEAAAHPAHVAYLYYVAAADGCGEQLFSTSLAQFEANAAAYQAAVRKNGGRPPTCKKK